MYAIRSYYARADLPGRGPRNRPSSGGWPAGDSQPMHCEDREVPHHAEEMGIQEGDTVSIFDFEFDYLR